LVALCYIIHVKLILSAGVEGMHWWWQIDHYGTMNCLRWRLEAVQDPPVMQRNHQWGRKLAQYQMWRGCLKERSTFELESQHTG